MTSRHAGASLGRSEKRPALHPHPLRAGRIQRCHLRRAVEQSVARLVHSQEVASSSLAGAIPMLKKPNTKPMEIREIREAMEWKARQELGPHASMLACASWTKRMRPQEIHDAREQHAREAARFPR